MTESYLSAETDSFFALIGSSTPARVCGKCGWLSIFNGEVADHPVLCDGCAPAHLNMCVTCLNPNTTSWCGKCVEGDRVPVLNGAEVVPWGEIEARLYRLRDRSTEEFRHAQGSNYSNGWYVYGTLNSGSFCASSGNVKSKNVSLIAEARDPDLTAAIARFDAKWRESKGVYPRVATAILGMDSLAALKDISPEVAVDNALHGGPYTWAVLSHGIGVWDDKVSVAIKFAAHVRAMAPDRRDEWDRMCGDLRRAYSNKVREGVADDDALSDTLREHLG